ncbi:predicted protein [Naegleria gruberi]|uniref:Glycine cleavage system P protein n=1 Tax=Naegleria gruberi TaxID=5762 RepID=D2VCV3_NAEGR|nr:uncharacterized protein NAEGRDRAFT_48514 [Naegleria gruberi]EFC45486.1 predicted protein [Naegleria gruberi]|eukprot:XP_002678230.1 predicted protein [Naegleria gruberi strain NEG-M]
MIGRSTKLIQSNKRVASVLKKNISLSSSKLFSTCVSACSSHLASLDTYTNRHNYQPENENVHLMLKELGFKSLEEMVKTIIPKSILYGEGERMVLSFDQDGKKTVLNGESDILAELYNHAKLNQVKKSLIGQGYYDNKIPNVILRNIFQNPGWYTPYTPYQAEISQGRLESLLNYQTMISDLTGLPIANASLLDEATAAAEAMAVCYNAHKKEVNAFFVASDVHPQTLAVIRARAAPLNISVVVGDALTFDFAVNRVCGALIQYPNTTGAVVDYESVVKKVHDTGALTVFATDLLALTVLKSPGEFGADLCIGSAQRFGVPLGYGGPSAGFLSVKDDYKRIIPGRIIGISKDAQGKTALRMALQTREQHIRRDKATSNICTAQALLANMASMYAVYHGPTGLKNIANRVHEMAVILNKGIKSMGYTVSSGLFFDTFTVSVSNTEKFLSFAAEKGYNFRKVDAQTISLSTDESININHLNEILAIFASFNGSKTVTANDVAPENLISSSSFARTTPYLTHSTFNKYHTEHAMLRYIKKLEAKDYSLCHGMIPLGSCTMKLNSVAVMTPVTWPEFGSIHPLAPLNQAQGYLRMIEDLKQWLSKITGFDNCSLQPNAGSQGEYAGLLVIKKYLESIGQGHRDICLIPSSAHGTNPASAVMCGLKVVVVECDKLGNVDVEDLKLKISQHKDKVASLMITYPSTHGVYEERVQEICNLIHEAGAQVYLDGANMNAQVALTSPGKIGADVCHLNLHKTFAIPHGGGGPGIGPICVRAHLSPFLPSHPAFDGTQYELPNSVGAVSASPFGSASVLPIVWMYIRMMGSEGLRTATSVAMLNANYLAKKLSEHYRIYYTAGNGLVAHEFIIDCNPFKKTTGIEAIDIAKRLMDYGFHAPTMSFPIGNTLMVEPTESEDIAELDRFIEAMISIRKEIRDIEEGKSDKVNNVLKNAPHTADVVTSDSWDRPYSREVAAFPTEATRERKYFPTVSRLNDSYGDKNICACLPIEQYKH